MKRLMANRKQKKAILIALAAPLMFSPAPLMAATGTSEPVVAIARQAQTIVSVQRINPTTVDVVFSNNQRMTFDFYGDNIFRMFQDNNGGILRDPEAKPEARILVDTPRRPVSKLDIQDDNGQVTITTGKVRLQLDKSTALLKVTNLTTNKIVFEETKPVVYEKGKTILTLKENPDEYFYGGGVQNGRFSHKGKAIAIENQNSWTDGGVASPTPFYWSTNGYGFMWYTFKQGKYDFGATEKNTVKLSHDTDYLDVFYMINDSPVALLNDFYQLTGNPILLPKFGFYQGHLNAYNRDYWVEDEKGILFEDGKRYKESQKDNGGIKESLNGEKNNYQFSARAVIDRYKNHDMPLGWLLPNDGYGAGYGQTETLDGNIQNLKSLTDYAHKNGVEIGLWTQSDLHPKDSISALLQRDIVKEVRDAGVRVLKTDVAWVGWGYSFGLNGVADVGHIMPYYGNDARPFIISLDGWAGTQRYAGVWSGDQTGGQWEYIRFHIPTYIGSGLSGQPNITSDMDGIFGGKNLVMNTRDFPTPEQIPTPLTPIMEYNGISVEHNELGGLHNTYRTEPTETLPAGTLVTLKPQLPDGTTDTGKWKWNTGENTKDLTVATDRSGIWRVTYTNENGVESEQMFSIAVEGDCGESTINPTITYNSSTRAATSINVLYNSEVSLSIFGVGGYGSYLWETGSTASSITLPHVTTSRTVSVIHTNQGGRRQETVFRINVQAARPDIIVNGGRYTDKNMMIVEKGDNVTLTATPADAMTGGTYLWGDGSTKDSLTINNVQTSASYTLDYTINGQTNTITYQIYVKETGYRSVTPGNYYIRHKTYGTYLTNHGNDDYPSFEPEDESNKAAQQWNVVNTPPSTTYGFQSILDGTYLTDEGLWQETMTKPFRFSGAVDIETLAIQKSARSGNIYWQVAEDGSIDFAATETPNDYPFEFIPVEGSKVSETTGGKIVARTIYYSMDGIQLEQPRKGINIRQTTFTDGSVKQDKIIIR